MALFPETSARKDRISGAAAAALSIVHILTVAGLSYKQKLPDELHFFLVNYGFALSPAVLVLLVRKAWPLVSLCAIPIVPVFLAAMYYVWERYWFGKIITNGVPHGEWVEWLVILMGMLSVPSIAFVLLLHAIDFVIQMRAKRRWEDASPPPLRGEE